MSCCRCKCIKTTSVAVVSGVLNLTIPANSFSNLDKFTLYIAQPIPSNAGTLPVSIVNGTGSAITFNTRFGNLVRADQIRCGKTYCVVYGNDPVHFQTLTSLPCTSYVPTPPTEA